MTNVTDKEFKVLRALYTNDFGDAPTDERWTDCINDAEEPSGITGKELSGVVASLAKKKLVNCYWSKFDATIALTPLGVEAAEA